MVKKDSNQSPIFFILFHFSFFRAHVWSRRWVALLSEIMRDEPLFILSVLWGFTPHYEIIVQVIEQSMFLFFERNISHRRPSSKSVAKMSRSLDRKQEVVLGSNRGQDAK